jgi:hypothetical protein
MPAGEDPPRTSRLLLLVAWLVVIIPAAWGVSQTVMRSLDLFSAPPASVDKRIDGK